MRSMWSHQVLLMNVVSVAMNSNSTVGLTQVALAHDVILLVSQLADITVENTGQARALAIYNLGFDALYTCQEYTGAGGMKPLLCPIS